MKCCGVTAIAMLLMATVAVTMSSNPGEASIWPMPIDGYVLDRVGDPVVGANVTVKVYTGTTLKATRYYDSTEVDGFYAVTFDGPQWDIGDLVEATATFGTHVATSSIPADGSIPMPKLNVTMPFPELLTLNLAAGWNMISLPFAGTDYMASTLGLRLGDLVVGWNSSTQSYDRTYIVGLSPQTADFQIVWAMGYWVYASAAIPLALHGNLPTGTREIVIDVPEGGGWAMLGLATLRTDLHASDIPEMANISGIISLVAYFDPLTGVYRSYIVGLPITDYPLVPGRAYWCYIAGDVTLTFNP